MKKFIALFLCLTLLLSGCSFHYSNEDQQTEESSVDSSAGNHAEVSTETATEATTETTLQESQEEEPPTQAATPHYTVKTDFSLYSPKSSPLPAVYTEIANTGSSLLPLSKPTALYPYYGLPQRVDYGGIEGELYGLTDPSGRLITKPIYSNIFPLKDYETGKTLPFWVLVTTDKATEEWEGEYYDMPLQRYGLVSMDGTIFLNCKYSLIELNDDRILCSIDEPDIDDPYCVEAYDPEGNLCFTSEDIPKDKELDHNYLSYGEGLYVVSLRDKNGGDPSAYFLDEDGNILFGPFLSALPFSDGLAAVTLEENKCTYLRRDGTLFSQTYGHANSFSKGVAIVSDENWDQTLINSAGEIVIPTSYIIISSEDGNAFLVQNSSDDTTNYFYNKQGEILCKTTGTAPNLLTDDLFYYFNTAGELILECVSSGAKLPFPESYYLGFFSHPTDPYIVLFGWPNPGEETTTHYILTKDLHIFATVEAQVSYFRETVEWGPDGSDGFAIRKGDQVTLYRSPNHPIGTYSVPEFQTATIFSDGSVAFVMDSYTEFHDRNGNLFFRYLFNAMDD